MSIKEVKVLYFITVFLSICIFSNAQARPGKDGYVLLSTEEPTCTSGLRHRKPRDGENIREEKPESKTQALIKEDLFEQQKLRFIEWAIKEKRSMEYRKMTSRLIFYLDDTVNFYSASTNIFGVEKEEHIEFLRQLCIRNQGKEVFVF